MKRATLGLVPPLAVRATMTDDAEALARIARGEIAGLAELYDRHAPALLRFAARLCGSSDADDIVQTTFERAARAAATFDHRSTSARSWLFGIAARVAKERRRSTVRFARAMFRLDTRGTHVPSGEARSDLQKGLARLSEAKRVVLLLAEVEGFTCEEIAVVLDVPVGTVWTRLHHARREMREFFEEIAK